MNLSRSTKAGEEGLGGFLICTVSYHTAILPHLPISSDVYEGQHLWSSCKYQVLEALRRTGGHSDVITLHRQVPQTLNFNVLLLFYFHPSGNTLSIALKGYAFIKHLIMYVNIINPCTVSIIQKVFHFKE